MIAESATVRRRQNNSNSREWEMLSSPSVDSGQFEVQCNVIVNGPVPSPDSPTNNNPSVETASSNQLENATSNPSNDAAVGGGVIRMSDLALVQRCSTLPRNYRKIIHPAPQTNNTCNPRASPIYCLAPAFSGSQLPPNVEIHQVVIYFFFFFFFKFHIVNLILLWFNSIDHFTKRQSLWRLWLQRFRCNWFFITL